MIALLAPYDKTGLKELARGLAELGVCHEDHRAQDL